MTCVNRYKSNGKIYLRGSFLIGVWPRSSRKRKETKKRSVDRHHDIRRDKLKPFHIRMNNRWIPV